MDIFEITICIFLFILGACVGSFFNVAIYRLPRFESISFPASHCTSCNTPLKFYHNVPIFSWIFLRGKCGFCKEKISPLYPAVEIMGGAFMLLVYVCEGRFYELENLGYVSTIALGLCFITLLALSIIDIRYKAVPDMLLNIGVVLSLGYGILKNLINNEPFYENLLSAGIFALSFWLLRFLVSFMMKKEAMGSADIYIAAIIGAILGLKLGLLAIYLSAILTLPAYAVVKKREYELAFIPFLSLALLITYAFKDNFLNLIGIIWIG